MSKPGPSLPPALRLLALGLSAAKCVPLVGAVGYMLWLLVTESGQKECPDDSSLCGEGVGLLYFLAALVLVVVLVTVPILYLRAKAAAGGNLPPLVGLSMMLLAIDLFVTRFLWTDRPGGGGTSTILSVLFVLAVAAAISELAITVGTHLTNRRQRQAAAAAADDDDVG